MVGNIVVLLGLCILPLCSPQLYHIVKDAKTWTEAQRYCREKHTDLVTISSKEDMVRLSHMLWDDGDPVWIGLYGDINNWKWSLERKGFYKEPEFRMWQVPQPNIFIEAFDCTNLLPSGKWFDYWCYRKLGFICYNEFSDTRFIYVTKSMNWTDAQKYCRESYTDLASVRSTNENEEIRKLVDKYGVWIGLYRESWKWSDGQWLQMTSFSNWEKGQPNKIIDSCVTTTHSKWNARDCNHSYAFVCSDDVMSKQTIKVMLRKSDSSVDLEEMQDSILQQYNQSLEDRGLGQKVRLRWIVQPDGKIFHLKEAEEEKELKKC